MAFRGAAPLGSLLPILELLDEGKGLVKLVIYTVDRLLAGNSSERNCKIFVVWREVVLEMVPRGGWCVYTARRRRGSTCPGQQNSMTWEMLLLYTSLKYSITATSKHGSLSSTPDHRVRPGRQSRARRQGPDRAYDCQQTAHTIIHPSLRQVTGAFTTAVVVFFFSVGISLIGAIQSVVGETCRPLASCASLPRLTIPIADRR